MVMTLNIKTRDAGTAAEDIRSGGSIPAVMYGPKESPVSIELDAKEFDRVFRDAGETTIIVLKGGKDGDKETLVKDVQRHPVTDVPLHVDFYVLEKGKKVTVSIPLEFVGQSPAEKAGYILVKALHEIEIEVAPAELPQHLEVDVSKLENVGDHILVKDIRLPASAEAQIDADEIVVSVTAFEEEEKEPAPAAEAAPEAAAPAATESKE